jgi:hypothetical protein
MAGGRRSRGAGGAEGLGEAVPPARAQLERIRADTPVTRRDYLRILVTVSAGLAAGAAGVAIGLFRRHGSGTAAPAKVADRLEPGQAVAFRYPGTDDRALAIRLPDGRLVGRLHPPGLRRALALRGRPPRVPLP